MLVLLTFSRAISRRYFIFLKYEGDYGCAGGGGDSADVGLVSRY